MPSYAHLVEVASQLRARLGTAPFLTIPRRDITDLVRAVSGEETTRIKREMAEQLERALLEQGARVFPSLQETSTFDSVRLFQPGTAIARIVDVLSHPGSATDTDLLSISRKIGAATRRRAPMRTPP